MVSDPSERTKTTVLTVSDPSGRTKTTVLTVSAVFLKSLCVPRYTPPLLSTDLAAGLDNRVNDLC